MGKLPFVVQQLEDLVLLGHAWCLNESGKSEEAIAKYREAVKVAWVHDGSGKAGYHSNDTPPTEEAAGLLIKLLDTEKDKKEIDDLNKKIEVCKQIPRIQ